MYATAAIIRSVTIVYKQNSSQRPKWKLKIEKEIVEYNEEIPVLDERNKGVKGKTRKVRKIKRKWGNISW